MSDKATTADLMERLRYTALRKEAQGFYAVMLEEVAVRNGARRLDALVMNCVPSRGLTLVGYEVKASRSDWLRELESPDKADLAAEYLDAFYLVTVPGVVAPGELPDRWGLMLPKARKRLAVEVEAKSQEGKDTPRHLLAGMLRTAIRQELTREVEAAREEAEAAARQRVENELQQARRRAEMAEERYHEMQAEWDEFAEASGERFGLWRESGDMARVAQILKALKEGERQADDNIAAPLRRQADAARQTAERLDRVVSEIEGLAA